MLPYIATRDVPVGRFVVRAMPLARTPWALYRLWVGDVLVLSNITLPSAQDCADAIQRALRQRDITPAQYERATGERGRYEDVSPAKPAPYGRRPVEMRKRGGRQPGAGRPTNAERARREADLMSGAYE
jgi:hypothetical protein